MARFHKSKSQPREPCSQDTHLGAFLSASRVHAIGNVRRARGGQSVRPLHSTSEGAPEMVHHGVRALTRRARAAWTKKHAIADTTRAGLAQLRARPRFPRPSDTPSSRRCAHYTSQSVIRGGGACTPAASLSDRFADLRHECHQWLLRRSSCVELPAPQHTPSPRWAETKARLKWRA